MKRCISSPLALMVCILLITGTTGCWNRRELNTLAILTGMGIDKAADPGQVQLTAQIVKPGELKQNKTDEKAGGGSSRSYWNVKSTGGTVFDALRSFTHQSSRKVYLPHNQVLIFGREIAEEGVRKYIDFFVRDPETRLNVSVLVSKATAGEILDIEPELEKTPAIEIAHLADAQFATSQSSDVKLKDFIARLLSKTMSPIAPVIEVSNDNGKKTALLSGMAVFKNDKLKGFLDRTETRGLLWVTGEVRSGIIKVDCPDEGGEKISLEIISASGRFVPELRDDRIHMKISVKERGNIGDQSCFENLAEPTRMAVLEQEKRAVIKDEIMAAVEKARELDADVFGFGEAIHRKYPKEWKSMEGKWDEIFKNIEIDVDIDAKLELTGQLTRPISPEQE